MYSKLANPKMHEDWVSPHSYGWYAQLAKSTGEYSYPWHCTQTEPNGENMFTEEVSQIVEGKKVLDVGCGHGDFTIQWSSIVKQIVGIDVTNEFVVAGNNRNLSSVLFVTANTRDRLPFETDEFDCAYNRKGPTSVYSELTRVVKKGGMIRSLHPGDRLSSELSQWFPNLFEALTKGTPVLNTIKSRLEQAMFTHFDIEKVDHIQYLHEPMDVVKLRCFGQSPSVHEMVIQQSMSEIERIFEHHANEQGLLTTLENYVVRAMV
ncbi:class I SAM-dependent methyltransferase [Paenibacillus pini]|uniref:Methyltransferase n=1 Tax=Paenibacillus pini JCM 16418 TaxID=1236976 RepID=W7YG67_9BACL|nr:methyltransferase domain-containing protein [Paenibacillus pini]GAF07472.1 methyltransferase [Paenibacillus pini JCM 16418]